MKDKLLEIEKTALTQIQSVSNLQELEQIKTQFLGKQGPITEILKQVPQLPKEQRPEVGKQANIIKQNVLEAFKGRLDDLENEKWDDLIQSDTQDYTLPSKAMFSGSKHPITQTRDQMIDIFESMGFSIRKGRDVETDFYNFEALNIPDDHPSRDMHDTFYFDAGRLLRTHTSAVQIHTMKAESPPHRIVVPGMVYRCDADVTHSPVFHQLEGLLVDEKVSFAQLKAVVEHFLKALFGTQRQVRFRPSYFPFTEPSCEVDVEWGREKDGSIKWMEIMGAGMVHRNVFRSVGYDPDQVRGFAFGVGVDRVAMLKYQIDDIRLLYENDQRFLEQF